MPAQYKKKTGEPGKEKGSPIKKKPKTAFRAPMPAISCDLPTVSNIGSVIKIFTSDPQISSKLKKSGIFNHWPEIVGKDIAAKTAPLKIFKGILYISVTTPTWANELSMMSRQLIDKINKFTGETSVKELRFKI